MIKAGDLMIGNWVYGDIRPNEPRQIKSIDRTVCMVGEYITGYEDVLPIPLTASILTDNCGFEKCLGSDYGDYQILCGKGTTANGLFIIIDLSTYGVVIGQLDHFSHEFGEYKYVNQLQNLYKALTKTELPIKF